MLEPGARERSMRAPLHPCPIPPSRGVGGNPYERHVAQWSHEKVLDAFDGIDEWWIGAAVGVYLAPGWKDDPRGDGRTSG